MLLKEYLHFSNQTPCGFALKAGVMNKTVLETVRRQRGSMSLEAAIMILNKCHGCVSINELLEELGSDVRYLFSDGSVHDFSDEEPLKPKKRGRPKKSQKN